MASPARETDVAPNVSTIKSLYMLHTFTATPAACQSLAATARRR
jgi:hypothetical protein